MKFTRSGWEVLVEFDPDDFLDPSEYESSEGDPLDEREEARVNRIVWGKKFYLPRVIIEGRART